MMPQLPGRGASTPLDARYGLELDYGSVGRLCEEHGLTFPDGQ